MYAHISAAKRMRTQPTCVIGIAEVEEGPLHGGTVVVTRPLGPLAAPQRHDRLRLGDLIHVPADYEIVKLRLPPRLVQAFLHAYRAAVLGWAICMQDCCFCPCMLHQP